MPFSNPILGGTALVRQAINSPLYIPGVQGWSINRDGSAEFNNASLRGALLIGSPPMQGAVSIGLTGAAIPAVLLAWSADYMWFEADIRWIDTTQFFFTALVRNTAFSITETVTGVYTTAGGVQLQSLTEAGTPNTINWGSATYDTAPLEWQWRKADIAIDSNSSFASDVPLNASTAGVPETWHAFAYSNGWTGTGAGYRLVISPPHTVQLTGELTVGTKADGTLVATLPIGYRPITAKDISVAVNSMAGAAAQSPHLAINTNGTIMCWGCSAATGTVGLNGLFPLDL